MGEKIKVRWKPFRNRGEIEDFLKRNKGKRWTETHKLTAK